MKSQFLRLEMIKEEEEDKNKKGSAAKIESTSHKVI